MEDFIFEYPTKVYFGKEATKNNLPKELVKYGKNIMLAYGAGSIMKNGIYQEVTALLKEAGKVVTEFSGIMPNPTYSKVLEGVKLAKENKIDFILAVGGGSVIDCCKIVAMQANMEEDLWQMELEQGKMPSVLPIPMGAVVTVSGTGSEMNAGAVITHEEKKIKTGLFGCAPCFAILDPIYTMSVPEAQVLSGAFDSLSHTMETYFGYPNEDNVSDDISEAIMKNTIRNMRKLLIDMSDYTARSNLMWDSAMAENGVLKIGKKTDFEAHHMEHQLGAYTDCNHGQGLAVLHPVYYKHIYNEGLPKFVKFALNVWGISKEGKSEQEVALEGINALADFIEECGLPTKLTQLRMKADAKELLTDETIRNIADSCNISQGSYKKMTHNEIYEIFKECY